MLGLCRCRLTNSPPTSDQSTSTEALCREAVQRLTNDRAALLMAQPFLASLAMQLPIVAVVDDRLSTTCTDGRNLFVNAPFIVALEPMDRRFVLAHAVWHCALLHPWRRQQHRSPWWDLAIDHETNSVLQALLPLPPDAVWYEPLRGRSAEQVYRELAHAGTCTGRGRLADVHPGPTVNFAAERSPAPHDTSASPAGQSQQAQRDPRYAPAVDQATREIWATRILAAAEQVQRWGGRLPGSAARVVDGLRHPELPWRDWLRQFVVSVVGDRRAWLPPSRRDLHRGLYLPSRREAALRLAVAVDTSASTQSMQVTFLSELTGLVHAYGRYEIVVIQGDARVQQVSTYTQDEPLVPSEVELKGFGGTDFRPVFAYLQDHGIAPAALVFLTDGRGDAPDHPPDYPVLWVLPRTGRKPSPWGRVVRLDDPAAPRTGAVMLEPD